jgi:hypothetical protein
LASFGRIWLLFTYHLALSGSDHLATLFPAKIEKALRNFSRCFSAQVSAFFAFFLVGKGVAKHKKNN